MKKSVLAVSTLLAVLLVLTLLTPKPAAAKITIDGWGNVFFSLAGQVLGLDDQEEDQSEDSEESEEDETSDDRSGKQDREDRLEKSESPESSSREKNTETNKKSLIKQRNLIISPENDRVRVSTEKSGKKQQFKYVIDATESADLEDSENDGKEDSEDLVEDDDQDATDSGEIMTDEVEIEPPHDENVISLRSKNNSSYVIRNKIAAQTHFPLQVNLLTNELIVTTPKGAKIVTILPDAAVQHMLAANVLDEIGGKGGILWKQAQVTTAQTATESGELEATDSGDLEATDSGELEATDSAELTPTPSPEITDDARTVVELVESPEGLLSYKVEGIKTKKLLGIKSIELPRTVYLSAETGEILSIQQDWINRLLSFFSTD